jgi:hypothetical protein
MNLDPEIDVCFLVDFEENLVVYSGIEPGFDSIVRYESTIGDVTSTPTNRFVACSSSE